jgi:hypothetical protein
MNARPVACLARPWSLQNPRIKGLSGPKLTQTCSFPGLSVMYLFKLLFVRLERPLPHGGSQPCLGLSYLVVNGASLSSTQITSSLGSKHPFGTLHV